MLPSGDPEKLQCDEHAIVAPLELNIAFQIQFESQYITAKITILNVSAFVANCFRHTVICSSSGQQLHF